jgi:hypothetical protein
VTLAGIQAVSAAMPHLMALYSTLEVYDGMPEPRWPAQLTRLHIEIAENAILSRRTWTSSVGCRTCAS